MLQRMLLASGNDKINAAIIKKGYKSIGTVLNKGDVFSKCESLNPDILLYGEVLQGEEKSIELLLSVKKAFPKTRIIYLAGQRNLEMDSQLNALGSLVLSGIYDIYHEKTLGAQTLFDLINNPKTLEDVDYLTAGFKKQNADSNINIQVPEEAAPPNSYDNVFVISSIKPGTGKSFVSVNLAAGIAKYGVPNKEGKKPRVAILEADLQTLSVGTLLCIEPDNKKNLKTVMDRIGSIISVNGDLIGGRNEIEDVNSYILNCFTEYDRSKNLKALTGSQLTFEEVENIYGFYYIYLIEQIVEHFDVIIVDTNSSLIHASTLPLLSMAKTCYYILNLDFNNVNNNERYRETLRSIGVLDKTKYILNGNIPKHTEEEFGGKYEELLFNDAALSDSVFDVQGKIPKLPEIVFNNRAYSGVPVVLDTEDHTLEARYEILKIANQIYPIAKLDKLEQQTANYIMKSKKKKSIFS